MTEDGLQLQVEVKYWRKMEDRFQLGLIVGLFVMMGILERMPHHTAKVAVLYFCGFFLCMTGVTAIISAKAYKVMMLSLNKDLEDINDAIQRIRNGRFEQK